MTAKAATTTITTATPRGSQARCSTLVAGASTNANSDAITSGTRSSRPKYSPATTMAPPFNTSSKGRLLPAARGSMPTSSSLSSVTRATSNGRSIALDGAPRRG